MTGPIQPTAGGAESTTAPAGKTAVRVHYETTLVEFAHRVLIQASRDQVILSFAASPVLDPKTGNRVMPVHSRIALTPAGAVRLLQSLKEAAKRSQASVETAP